MYVASEENERIARRFRETGWHQSKSVMLSAVFGYISILETIILSMARTSLSGKIGGLRDFTTGRKLGLHTLEAFVQLDFPAFAGIVVSESELTTQLCKNFLIIRVELNVLTC
jgi:hypothetical protein